MKHSTLRILGLGFALAVLLVGTTPARADDDFPGKYAAYKDTYNGYALLIPETYKQSTKGATTTWDGPVIDGGGTTIYINVVEMKSVPSKILYDTNFKSKKDDRNYTDVVPVTSIRYDGHPVLAFRCKEADHKNGSADPKDPTDIHRWHLFVFGGGRFYTCGFTGMVASFKAGRLPPVYDKVIHSMQLYPAN